MTVAGRAEVFCCCGGLLKLYMAESSSIVYDYIYEFMEEAFAYIQKGED